MRTPCVPPAGNPRSIGACGGRAPGRVEARGLLAPPQVTESNSLELVGVSVVHTQASSPANVVIRWCCEGHSGHVVGRRNSRSGDGFRSTALVLVMRRNSLVTGGRACGAMSRPLFAGREISSIGCKLRTFIIGKDHLVSDREAVCGRRHIRQRIHLHVVQAADALGVAIPPRHAGVAFRGHGAADYVCGQCGTLLAIGVRPGMFTSLALECGCGATNRVPDCSR